MSDSPSYFVLINDCGPDTEYRVVLVQGAHRTAALAFLGWGLVPMTPEFAYSAPEVCLSDMDRWPGVVDGAFSRESAELIFSAFFREEDEVLSPGW